MHKIVTAYANSSSMRSINRQFEVLFEQDEKSNCSLEIYCDTKKVLTDHPGGKEACRTPHFS